MASMDQPDAIVSIASDPTAAHSSEERHRRLLGALRKVILYDAAALPQAMIPFLSQSPYQTACGPCTRAPAPVPRA